jgi:hypothetical protein
MTFPTKFGAFDLTDQQLAAWQVYYPSMDVRLECGRAYLWLEANPHRRKTPGGMLRFLSGWLKREQRQQAPRSAAQQPTYIPWTCPHVEAHSSRWRCDQALALGRPRKGDA